MAVLRIFDVLARVQERSAIKAAVHIPGVRNIVSARVGHPSSLGSLEHTVYGFASAGWDSHSANW